MRIQIRRINLVDVPGEDQLGVLSRACDDRLDLMRGKVLGLIDDEDHVGEAAAADIRQGSDFDLFRLRVDRR